MFWINGTTFVTMESQQFGGAFTDVNQLLDIFILVNLISGGQNDSMLTVIPQESGSLYTDNSWSGVPEIKDQDYLTLNIGKETTLGYANSIYEYLRLYEWDGTKPTITDSDDITDYLADKKLLLDKTYMNRLTATDLLIAGSTINAGDTITLRGNDWDSYNSGTPVDETVTWSKDIITHSFTKASHQYWRLSVNSSNIIDIGRIFLGLSYTTPYIGVNVADSYESNTIKTRTPNGNSYGDLRHNHHMYSVKWPYCSVATDKPALIDAFDAVDISKPFFVTFDESNIDIGTVYVTIDGNGLHFNYLVNPAYVEASISLLEEK